MARSYRKADITVRIPFGATEPGRIALLKAAGIPMDAHGDVAWGFLHERVPVRFGVDTICRWFDTGNGELPALSPGLQPASAAHGARK